MKSSILVSEEYQIQKGVIPYAAVFKLDGMFIAEEMIATMENIVSFCNSYTGNADRVSGVYLSEILSDKWSFAVKFSDQIPNDEAFLDKLLHHLKSDYQRTSIYFETNFDLDRTIVKKPLPPRPTPRSDFKPPQIPIEQIKPSLRFMRSPEFIVEGEDFYRAVSYICSSSRKEWIQEYFANRLEQRWPEIARADRAIGGLISEALTVVAQNHPNFPPWWRSIAVCLSRGAADSIEKVCTDVIEYQVPR